MDKGIPENYEWESACIKLLIEQAQKGETVRILGLGISMRPLLRNGKDYIDLIAVTDDTPLKKGDVVLYLSDGIYVLHRIFQISKKGYAMLGDGNLLVESPLPRDAIFLKATGYLRKGKYLKADALPLKIYGWLWMKLRILRPFIWKILYHIHKLCNHLES